MLLSHRHMDFISNPVSSGAGDIVRPQVFSVPGDGFVTGDDKKFGTRSLQAPGTGRFTTSGHTDDSYTIELWYKSTALSNYNSFFGAYNSSGNQTQFAIAIFNNNTITVQNVNQSNVDFTLSSSLSINIWYHIAFTRSGNTFKCYINGTQSGGDKTLSGTTLATNDNIRIGNSVLGRQDSAQYIDEVRLSKGLRYTGNFTAPTAAFSNDTNTILLCHCEEWPLVDDNS